MDTGVRQPSRRSSAERRWQERLVATLERTPRGGPAVVAGVGTGLFLVSFLNYFQNVEQLGFDWPQVAAVVLAALLSAFIVYGAVYLAESGLSARERWAVAGATLGGLGFLYVVMYLAVVVRLSAGEMVGHANLQLLASADAGAIAGFVIGLLYLRARQDAREARRVGEQLEFLHGILRHDVLNSMMVVRARAEHLESQLDDEKRDQIDAIVTQTESVIDLSRRARAMVDALAAHPEVTPEPVDLSSTLREEVSTLRTSYDEVTVTAPIPNGVTVLADGMLAEVLGNVLGNAVRHNDADYPRVSVRVTRESDTVTVRVADDGPGVPDARKNEIFERGRSSVDGGFGLFFVRTMVDHYGGHVHVEDNDPRGAVFVIGLRRADA